eukprot:1178700-Prorocentrum_minimum.AAC.1
MVFWAISHKASRSSQHTRYSQRRNEEKAHPSPHSVYHKVDRHTRVTVLSTRKATRCSSVCWLLQVVAYVYELVDGDVKVDKIEFSKTGSV